MTEGEEVIKLLIKKDVYEHLYKEGYIVNEDYQIISIEPHEEKYPEDERWSELKARADKAYKELKKRAFELRHER